MNHSFLSRFDKIGYKFALITGPHTWAENYAEAAGKRQSPIDIQTNDVTLDPKLSARQLTYTWPSKTADVTNTGYCWKAHVHGEGSVLEGGPLKDKYQLEQYHCHWGVNDSVGSEHLVDGQSYAAEVSSFSSLFSREIKKINFFLDSLRTLEH